jgi:hypothetical protein
VLRQRYVAALIDSSGYRSIAVRHLPTFSRPSRQRLGDRDRDILIGDPKQAIYGFRAQMFCLQQAAVTLSGLPWTGTRSTESWVEQ